MKLKKSWSGKALLFLLLLAGFGAAVLLVLENRRLRERIALLENRSAPPAAPAQPLREGVRVPEFTARDTEGREVRVGRRGQGSVLLFIYDPGCERCEEGMPAWGRLHDKLALMRAPVTVQALSVSDSYITVQHARRMKLPFSIVPFPNGQMQRSYGVTEVPLTVALDAEGVVQAVWNKPLDDGEAGDVLETVCPECFGQAMAAGPLSLREGKNE